MCQESDEFSRKTKGTMEAGAKYVIKSQSDGNIVIDELLINHCCDECFISQYPGGR